MENWQQLAAPAVFAATMLALFWFVVIRPTQQRQKKHQELVTAVVPGDEVVTVGGIIGTVKRVSEKTIELEISEGVVITMDRRAIRRLRNQEDF